MDTTTVISGLLTKRAEIQKAISDGERQARKVVRDHRSALAKIDAATELFEPGVVAAKRKVSIGERSAHFAIGELSRRCQTAFGEANCQPITADEIGVTAMREQNLDLGDCDLRQDITRRFIWTLNRHMTREAVVREG